MKKVFVLLAVLASFAAVSPAMAQEEVARQEAKEREEAVPPPAPSVTQPEVAVPEQVVPEQVVPEEATPPPAPSVTQPEVAVPEQKKAFNVYADKYTISNHFIPSGWMGDYGDIRMDDGCVDGPFGGKTCIKITYTAKGAQGAGWMGIYWQNPANNWGDRMGGYDLTGYKKLTFYARGEKGGEVIGEFKVGGISGNYSDSDSTSIGPITLEKEWKQYEIDLKGLDLSFISGGFVFSASSKDNPEGFVFYLDDIKFEQEELNVR